MSDSKKWYVYQNLNDSSDCIVASDAVMVAGIYTLADGPFDTEKEAQKRAEEIRRRVTPIDDDR